MKRSLLAALLVLAVGCAPAPDNTPVSDATDIDISIPDVPSEGETEETESDAELTMVTLNVPGMT